MVEERRKMDQRLNQIADDVSYMRGAFEEWRKAQARENAARDEVHKEHGIKIRKLEDQTLMVRVAAVLGISGGGTGIWMALSKVLGVG